MSALFTFCTIEKAPESSAGISWHDSEAFLMKEKVHHTQVQQQLHKRGVPSIYSSVDN